MREGTRVQTKDTKDIGNVTSIIGSVAIVKFGNEKRKVLLSNLIIAENTINQTQFIEAHQDMLGDESIQSFFEEKLNEDDIVYHKTILLSFGVELYNKLFDKDES